MRFGTNRLSLKALQKSFNGMFDSGHKHQRPTTNGETTTSETKFVSLSNRLKKQIRYQTSLLRKYGLFFIPGALLSSAGLAVIVAPHMVTVLLAGFFVFTGFCLSILAIKFIQLKRKVETIARSFEARLLIQPIASDQQNTTQATDLNLETATDAKSGKRIIFH